MAGIPEYSSIQNNPDHRSDADKLNSSGSIFDPTNPEIANMERQAFNYIQRSGAVTNIFLRANDLAEVDDIWEEDANPMYNNPTPIKGQFVPEPMSVSLKKWGVDSMSKFKINYSRAQLLAEFNNRLIRPGDVIQVPHNTLVQTQNTEYIDGVLGVIDKFRVVEAHDEGNFNYRWLYWVCTVEPLTGDISVRPPNAC